MNQILAPAFEVNPKVLSLAAKVKLLLFDVDGVLTDGRLVIGDDRQEYKAFNSRDGLGALGVLYCCIGYRFLINGLP